MVAADGAVEVVLVVCAVAVVCEVEIVHLSLSQLTIIKKDEIVEVLVVLFEFQ